MPLPFRELFFLIAGAVIGVYLQAGREKVKRIRNEVCAKMTDEIRSAKLRGDINQEDRWTKWTELEDLVKRELPEGLREEFNRYFQLVVDLDEEKEKLGYRNQDLGSKFADESAIIKWENADLRVATAEYTPPTETETEIHYGADFEEWVLEYGPVLAELLEEQETFEPIPDEVEEAIRTHEPDNYDFKNLPETWDSITGNRWASFIHDLYLSAEANNYSLYIQLMENNKRRIRESVEEIDTWFTIIAKTNIYVPYWLTIKKLLVDLKDTGFRGTSENEVEYEIRELSEM